MKRSDIVVINIGSNIGKPRPVLIMQNDILNETLATTVVIPFSSDIQDADTFRYIIPATKLNGLQLDSQLMIDKISQIPQNKIQKRIGYITKKQMDEVEGRLLAILGIK